MSATALNLAPRAESAALPADSKIRSHLDWLESEAIHILREVAAACANPAAGRRGCQMVMRQRGLCHTGCARGMASAGRQRLQAGVAAGPLTRVIAASARAGPRVLYAGFVPFLLRTIPLDALQFFVYAGLQSARERADAVVEDRPPPAAQSAVQVWLADAGLDMILGGIAGGVSAFATMPLDCVKTHINCQTGGGPTGVIPVTKAIWKASGPRGFFAGTSSRLAERVPSCAVYWLAAEATRRVLSPEAGAEAAAA